jgi:small-conductance mechanosensitive channel
MDNLGRALHNAGASVADHLLAYSPKLLGAIVLLLVGWALAGVLRALTQRGVLLTDTVLARLKLASGSTLRLRRAAAVIGTIVFWGVLLVFVTAATQVLELNSFTDWLARLVGYLPTLVVGAFIVTVGYVLSRFVADLVTATAVGLESAQRAMLARIAQVSIFGGSLLVGADQIGIKITFLAIFAGAVARIVGGAVALAVGLGARDYVANLIGARYLRQAFAIGQVIRTATPRSHPRSHFDIGRAGDARRARDAARAHLFGNLGHPARGHSSWLNPRP